MNSIRPPIQFTRQKEQDNKSSFQDVLKTHSEQGFSTSVYRKSTFTGQYLNFKSHHSYNVEKGIVRCVQHRAKAISRDSNVYQEVINSLRDNLYRNNYPENITSTTRNLDRTTENQTRKLSTLCLLSKVLLKRFKRYVHKISGQYSGVARTHRKYLFQVKPPTEYNMTMNCIYAIPFSSGKVYKGETFCSLKVGLDKHRKAVV